MKPALDRIYRKTAAGVAALKTRSQALPPGARTALILVNGRSTVAQLAAQLGEAAPALIEGLVDLGLVECSRPAPPAAPASVVPALPVVPDVVLPLSTSPSPAPAAAAPTPLPALKRRALQALTPQFGPDAELVCRTLLAAPDEAAFGEALGAIEAKLAIYLGRKEARRLTDALRP